MTRSRIRSVLLVTLAMLVMAPVAQALVTPKKVVGGGIDQWEPSANDTWVTFSAYENKTSSVQAMRRSSGFTFKMNEVGTKGSNGGLDPDANLAIYQQFTDSSSAIYLYNLDERTRRKAPGVNSRAWEWDPRISARYFSFFRNRVSGGTDYIDLFVYRRDTGALRKVASFKRPAYEADGYLYLWNGSVGDRYVTWTSWANKQDDSDVFVYDAVERSTRRVTGGDDRVEYAGVVDEANGFVYFIRSGNRCAQNVAIWRIPLDHLAGTPTKVAGFPEGYDAGWTASIAVDGGGGTDYYFERGSCEKWNADVYVAEGVDAA